MKKILSLSLILLSVNSFAGYLVKDASVTRVSSTNWDEKVFTVSISGGTGDCLSSVTFPEEYSQSTVAYSLSFSMAMSAYLHNKKITVYNYGDKEYQGNKCHGANFIEIHD